MQVVHRLDCEEDHEISFCRFFFSPQPLRHFAVTLGKLRISREAVGLPDAAALTSGELISIVDELRELTAIADPWINCCERARARPMSPSQL